MARRSHRQIPSSRKVQDRRRTGNRESTYFCELFDEFLEKHNLSEVRKKNFRVVKRALMRYELFVRKTRRGMKHFTLDIHTTTKRTLADMWDFMENEYMYAEEYPDIYETIPRNGLLNREGRILL